jgi:mevalonate kinase
VLRTADRLLKAPRNEDEPGVELHLSAAVPASAGVGSSAALCVVLVRALAYARGIVQDDETTRAKAHELEKIFHGSPSGLDDTVATYGGLCLFRRNGFADPPAPAKAEWPRLNAQTYRVPFAAPPLAVAYTGVARSTRTLVERVQKRRQNDTSGTERLFDDIEAALCQGLDALATADWAALGRAMGQNQTALARLGLSNPTVDRLIALSLGAGAYGAKLTGAGGGGCVIAVAPDILSVLAAWRRHGFLAWSADESREALSASNTLRCEDPPAQARPSY